METESDETEAEACIEFLPPTMVYRRPVNRHRGEKCGCCDFLWEEHAVGNRAEWLDEERWTGNG